MCAGQAWKTHGFALADEDSNLSFWGLGFRDEDSNLISFGLGFRDEDSNLSFCGLGFRDLLLGQQHAHCTCNENNT